MTEIRVARIIGRLNIGGPTIQAITLTKLLEPRGYRTLLIRGSEADHEGSLDDLVASYGVHPKLIAGSVPQAAPIRSQGAVRARACAARLPLADRAHAPGETLGRIRKLTGLQQLSMTEYLVIYEREGDSCGAYSPDLPAAPSRPLGIPLR